MAGHIHKVAAIPVAAVRALPRAFRCFLRRVVPPQVIWGGLAMHAAMFQMPDPWCRWPPPPRLKMPRLKVGRGSLATSTKASRSAAAAVVAIHTSPLPLSFLLLLTLLLIVIILALVHRVNRKADSTAVRMPLPHVTALLASYGHHHPQQSPQGSVSHVDVFRSTLLQAEPPLDEGWRDGGRPDEGAGEAGGDGNGSGTSRSSPDSCTSSSSTTSGLTGAGSSHAGEHMSPYQRLLTQWRQREASEPRRAPPAPGAQSAFWLWQLEASASRKSLSSVIPSAAGDVRANEEDGCEAAQVEADLDAWLHVFVPEHNAAHDLTHDYGVLTLAEMSYGQRHGYPRLRGSVGDRRTEHLRERAGGRATTSLPPNCSPDRISPAYTSPLTSPGHLSSTGRLTLSGGRLTPLGGLFTPTVWESSSDDETSISGRTAQLAWLANMESQLFQCDVVIGSEAVGGVGFTPVPAAHGSPASNSSALGRESPDSMFNSLSHHYPLLDGFEAARAEELQADDAEISEIMESRGTRVEAHLADMRAPRLVRLNPAMHLVGVLRNVLPKASKFRAQRRLGGRLSADSMRATSVPLS